MHTCIMTIITTLFRHGVWVIYTLIDFYARVVKGCQNELVRLNVSST